MKEERSKIKEHFDKIAEQYDYYKRKNSYYYSLLKQLYSSLIPQGKTILEIGCGTGEILNYLNPKHGVGVDISLEMVKIARKKYPNLSFEVCDAENLTIEEEFSSINTGVSVNLMEFAGTISSCK